MRLGPALVVAAAPTLASAQGIRFDLGRIPGADGATTAPATAPAAAAPVVAYEHGESPGYRAVRTDRPPRIDGRLDDEVWRRAPVEKRFLWMESKPYGEPTPDPTEVQVAYDSDALYVAFRFAYEGGQNRFPDAAPLEETDHPELVAVHVDGPHNHFGGKVFVLSPRGYRADWELWNSGYEANFEWTGIWEGATQREEAGWTAEFEIPWGTVGVGPSDGPIDVGIDFIRGSPGRDFVWAMPPPGSPRPLPPYYGHLEGIEGVSRRQIITLVPYAAMAYSPSTPSYRTATPTPRLRDLDQGATPLQPYAGLYGRLQVGAPLRVDFMVNPDFSQVNPDAALANLDRYELFFPEQREFFVEANPTFRFGADRYQLFYSRRIGLRQRFSGFDEVPLPYGVNMTYRSTGGTTFGLLDVFNERLPGPNERNRDTTVEASHVTVARAQQVLGTSRVGLIALNQTQPYSLSAYRAFGADGLLSLYKDHFSVSGFAVLSQTLFLEDVGGASEPYATPGDYRRTRDQAWMIEGRWRSQELEAALSYIDVGPDFRADLGFFELIGVRRTNAAAYYRPQVHTDLVHSAAFGTVVERSVTSDRDELIVQKVSTVVEAFTPDRAKLSFVVTRAEDQLLRSLFVGGRRLIIPAGSYSGVVTLVGLRTGVSKPLDLELTYQDGHYFGGTQRILSPSLIVHRGPLALNLIYQHITIAPGPNAYYSGYPDERGPLRADRLSARMVFAPTAAVRLSLAAELNTFDAAATTQVVASWRLKSLTNLVLVASRSGPGVEAYRDEPFQRVLLKLTYGLAVP